MQRQWLLAWALLVAGALTSRGDEGMWLFNQPPRELLKQKHGFDLDDAWLERAMKASVRFPSGSGGFVSPKGLVVTNHHIGGDHLQKLSKPGKDLYKDGFHARAQHEELKCPDLELVALQAIEDVTAQVQESAKGAKTPADAAAARRAAIARIEKESQAKTGMQSQVVTLYHGGLYHLYRYKKYTDVRLVLAPEHDIASFGGDVDNFEYPRHCLDVCFFRVWEDGRPAMTEHYFPWSAAGPAEGDLVFVTGHPGTTNRLETLAKLKHRRDVTLPYMLQVLRYREAILTQYGERGPEQARLAGQDLYSVANARKAITGQYHGLLEPAILARKEAEEKSLRDPVEADPAKDKAFGSPWKRMAEVQPRFRAIEREYYLFERGDAFDSRLFRIARHLARLADELPKDDGKRLSEYRSSALDTLKRQLFSPAPISEELERVKLTASLAFLAENLGGEHPLVTQVLGGRSPAVRAAELIAGSKLGDVAERQRLFDGGKDALAKSADTVIQLARAVDPAARKVRRQQEALAAVETEAATGIARVLFEKHGTRVPPDATFTLRLAFGVVKGYSVDGVSLPFHTTLGEAFARAKEHRHRPPFQLPPRWLERQGKVDLATAFDFVSTADTIGGNSGSPVINRAGHLVGINFDRNRHGLVRNFVYTEEQARHISVHCRAVLEALHSVYDAGALLKELSPR